MRNASAEAQIIYKAKPILLTPSSISSYFEKEKFSLIQLLAIFLSLVGLWGTANALPGIIITFFLSAS